MAFVALALPFSGCERAPKALLSGGGPKAKAATPAKDAPPTEADLKFAREVMNLSDVLVMLRAGVPNETIISEVQRRHIPQVLVEAGELGMAANGANRHLIAALKDPRNMLTESQDKAYSQVFAEKFKAAKR